jgi:hypothetical protein
MKGEDLKWHIQRHLKCSIDKDEHPTALGIENIPPCVIIYKHMKLTPLTSTVHIFGVRPEHRTTVERYLLAAG